MPRFLKDLKSRSGSPFEQPPPSPCPLVYFPRKQSIGEAGELERLQGMVEFLLNRLKELGVDTPPSLLDGFLPPPAYDVPIAPRRRYTPTPRPATVSSRSSSDAGIVYGSLDSPMGTRSHSPSSLSAFQHAPPTATAARFGQIPLTTTPSPPSSFPTFRSISSTDGFSYSLVHYPTQESNHAKRHAVAVFEAEMQK